MIDSKGINDLLDALDAAASNLETMREVEGRPVGPEIDRYNKLFKQLDDQRLVGLLLLTARDAATLIRVLSTVQAASLFEYAHMPERRRRGIVEGLERMLPR